MDIWTELKHSKLKIDQTINAGSIVILKTGLHQLNPSTEELGILTRFYHNVSLTMPVMVSEIAWRPSTPHRLSWRNTGPEGGIIKLLNIRTRESDFISSRFFKLANI